MPVQSEDWLASSFAQDYLKILVDKKLAMSQQSEKGQDHLCQLERAFWQAWGGGPSSLYSALVGPQPECWDKGSAPLYERDMSIWLQVQCRIMKMMKTRAPDIEVEGAGIALGRFEGDLTNMHT